MLVIPERKALVVKTRHPNRLLATIPTAKALVHNGNTLVAVPHRRDEVHVLRNMGFKAPAPMDYYYLWSGQYTPFIAQRTSACFKSMHRRAYDLSGMGSGKTLSTLWAYDYLRSTKQVRRLLVICPLSTMERTWADEVFRHFPHLDVNVLYGDRARRLKLLKQEADIYVVNHDGAKIIGPALAERDDIDIVVVDELAQVARNKSTDRWKALDLIINKQQQGNRWAWGLTGTPTPNDPTDAWAQCLLIKPGSVPPYYSRFRDVVMRQVSHHVWVPKPDAQQTVFDAMQPAIRFSREECVDLPECMVQTLEVELTPEQKKAYNEMFTRLRTEAAEGDLVALNEAIKISKLVQIACGVAYDVEGNEVTIPSQPRLDAVLEVIKGAESKVIVFVPFVSSINHVARFIASQGIGVECIHGGVPKTERDRIFDAFQRRDDPQVLVAQPAAMSHGLTLTKASVVVWYAPINSNDIYEQACARITRPGQKLKQFIINIEGCVAERKIYARLRNKQAMQGLLLDMVVAERDELTPQKPERKDAAGDTLVNV